jgi:hypothetical protein
LCRELDAQSSLCPVGKCCKIDLIQFSELSQSVICSFESPTIKRCV